MVADTDDDREANARVKGQMSIMCIISLLNYQALNMGAALPRALVIFSDRYSTIVVLGLHLLMLNLTHSVSVWCVRVDEEWR